MQKDEERETEKVKCINCKHNENSLENLHHKNLIECAIIESLIEWFCMNCHRRIREIACKCKLSTLTRNCAANIHQNPLSGIHLIKIENVQFSND